MAEPISEQLNEWWNSLTFEEKKQAAEVIMTALASEDSSDAEKEKENG